LLARRYFRKDRIGPRQQVGSYRVWVFKKIPELSENYRFFELPRSYLNPANLAGLFLSSFLLPKMLIFI
jgi:hypothetical protein